jgi:uncharacterized repeat protein (TIGR01451 family)
MKRLQILLSLLILLSAPVFGQYEMPGSIVSNVKTIPAGSLIIAMDTTLQYRPGYFNMKAYGLVSNLLENEIPVMWAIRKGKTRSTLATQIDFTVNNTRVFPDTGTATTNSFNSGPFIIDTAWASKALPIITAYGNGVNVYRTNNNVDADIRYTLTFKPRVCLLNLGGYDTINVKMMQEAGIPSAQYTLRTPSNQIFNSNNQYSLLSEQHYVGTDTARINSVLRYLTINGGNMVASCATIGSFENSAYIMTTAGIDSVGSGISGVSYFNIDLPNAQFHGNLITPNGEYRYWQPKSGSIFRTSSAYQVVRSSGGTGFYLVTGTKLQPLGSTGGVLTFLSGHSFYMETSPGSINETARINGRRIYMDHLFIPPGDSIAANLDFTTDVAIALQPQPGFAVKNESFKLYVIASNIGYGRAKNVVVNAPLASGVTLNSFTTTKGGFNPVSGIWLLDSLQKGRSDTLVLNVTIAQLGNITFTSNIRSETYETHFPNNTATLNLFGVSRPNAENDTIYYNTPSYVDYYIKINDSDEDNGPFSISQILQGPNHGTAVLIGDSIRYTLGSGFTGKDSVLYSLCDQLPLCDSAWVYFIIPSALPVNMGSFNGERKNGLALLTWSTLSEKDNDYFLIERSTNGRLFEKAAIVDAVGNSSALQWYGWNEPDTEAPILYYTMTQLDFDGGSTFSGLIALPKYEKKNTFTIYPNPAGEEFILQASNVHKPVTFTLSDLSGRKIIEEIINPDSENRVTRITTTTEMARGLYIATLRTSSTISSLKLMLR